MYVCLCMGVTDTQIREKVEQGCGSIDALQEALDVGKNCGQCMEMVQEILQEALVLQKTKTKSRDLVKSKNHHRVCQL